MFDNELHELALTSAKYYIESNLDKYTNNLNGQTLLVSDLLNQYLIAKKQINNQLPNIH